MYPPLYHVWPRKNGDWTLKRNIRPVFRNDCVSNSAVLGIIKPAMSFNKMVPLLITEGALSI
jgi:hypothetical protein